MNIIRRIKGTSLEAVGAGWYNFLPPKQFATQFSSRIEQGRNLFFNNEVQNLLQSLTRVNQEKIFRVQKLGKRLSSPELKFMTDEELEEARSKALVKAQVKLQMPPILPPRSEINRIFVKDQKLENYSDSKYVFTDISYGKNDRNRHIVVREVDGTLRKAKWEERERSNEIYFHRPGRKLRLPQMFKSPYFEDVLSRGCFDFILDRACAQFEPDDPLYISITRATYDKIAETGRFQEFESTRHYGPMVYHYTDKENLAPLLIHYLNHDRLEDIFLVIKLHSILHPGRQYATNLSCCDISLVKKFIAECYPNKADLELALKSYEDYLSQAKAEAAV